MFDVWIWQLGHGFFGSSKEFDEYFFSICNRQNNSFQFATAKITANRAITAK